MFPRCVLCDRRIMPWDHYGFWIRRDGSEARWHAGEEVPSLRGRDVRRDSEEVVGRIPVYDYSRDMGRSPVAHESTHATWSDVWRALAGFVVIGGLFVGVFLWMAIAQSPVR